MLDQAFVVSADLLDDKSITVDFKIHPEAYLYGEKINFSSDTHSVKTTDMTKGKIKNDDFFGKIEIHKNQATATITLSETISKPVNITVGYQGCWEGGVCYPPQKISFNLDPASK
jgi:thiol:disulfide interchange protein DsbD